MPFMVAHPVGIQRRDFDAYLRLLEQRQIDWTRSLRVPEPGTTNHWLYVWEDKENADEFCAALQRETRDNGWYVRALDPQTTISEGPLTPIVIHMRRASLGASFSLHPHSRTLVERRFPQARPVSSISIEYINLIDLDRSQSDFWDHIAVVLTGLSCEQLEEQGGYRVFDLRNEETIFDTTVAVTSAS